MKQLIGTADNARYCYPPNRSDCVRSVRRPWKSPSYPMVARVPPGTPSKVLRKRKGSGPDMAFHAATRSGSYSVSSHSFHRAECGLPYESKYGTYASGAL